MRGFVQIIAPTHRLDRAFYSIQQSVATPIILSASNALPLSRLPSVRPSIIILVATRLVVARIIRPIERDGRQRGQILFSQVSRLDAAHDRRWVLGDVHRD